VALRQKLNNFEGEVLKI